MQLTQKKLIRLILILWSSLILIGLFRGRYLQNTYGWAISYIAPVSIFVLLFVIISFCVLHRKIHQTKFSSEKVIYFSLLTGIFLGVTYLLSSYFIAFEIERMHLLKYEVLAVLCFYSLEANTFKRFAYTLFISTFIGISEEIAQLWVPQRIFDPKDIALNFASCFAGSLLALGLKLISTKENEE